MTLMPSETQAAAGGSTDDAASNDTDRQSETTYTPRFTGFVVLLAVLVAVGLMTLTPFALAAGALLVVFLMAGVIQTPTPPRGRLLTDYRVQPKHPRPGDTVTVEVTVTNNSERTFTDLRLVDTIPVDLEVVDGTPRRAATLRPGNAVTVEYDVVARRGEYTFGPVRARARTLIGSMWVQQSLETRTPGTMRCAVRADDIPIEEEATHYLGDLLSDVGGDGVEFYSTREYHRGDPPSRINWRELAKRQELSTVTYRERQAADITVITDARSPSRVSASPGEPSGATLATYATYQILSTLVERGHYVRVAVPGLQPTADEANSFPCRRIEHGSGDEQKRRAFELFEEIDTLSRSGCSGEQGLDSAATRSSTSSSLLDGTSAEFIRSLTGWTSPNTQFIFVSPLLDDSGRDFCQQLRQRGFAVLVISPDVTTAHQGPSVSASGSEDSGAASVASTIPEQTVRLQRATRIERLRQDGYTVIDWDPEQPLSVCCEQQTLPGGGTG